MFKRCGTTPNYFDENCSLYEMYGKLRVSIILRDELSLICLHFIHLCCHYFTYRDDILLYNGKSGIGDTSIQFTIDSIPSSNRLLNQKNLINDGYVGRGTHR